MKLLSFILLTLLLLAHEGECRRKILKGRKAITRTYHRESGIPGWAIVTIVGLSEIIFGGLLFLILKITILDEGTKPGYIPVLKHQRTATP